MAEEPRLEVAAAHGGAQRVVGPEELGQVPGDGVPGVGVGRTRLRSVAQEPGAVRRPGRGEGVGQARRDPGTDVETAEREHTWASAPSWRALTGAAPCG